MKKVTLTKLQCEEIAYRVELAKERDEENKLDHDSIDLESLYRKVAFSTSRNTISLTTSELYFIQVEMSSSWDNHGSMDVVGDYEQIGYNKMCSNLFKKLNIQRL